MKLYDPEINDSFTMMFGFPQPDVYKMPKVYKDKRIKKYGMQRKHKGEINKYKRNENN